MIHTAVEWCACADSEGLCGTTNCCRTYPRSDTTTRALRTNELKLPGVQFSRLGAYSFGVEAVP